MRLSIKNLLSLPVETESKTMLGKVADVVFDVEAHIITEYQVSVGILSKKKFLIKPTQVISITADKMIVEDAVLKEMETAKEKQTGQTEILVNVSQIIKE